MKAYLPGIDFTETANYIADQVNSAAPDLSAEKAELIQISTQIANGVKATLSGIIVPKAHITAVGNITSEGRITFRGSETHRSKKISQAIRLGIFLWQV